MMYHLRFGYKFTIGQKLTCPGKRLGRSRQLKRANCGTPIPFWHVLISLWSLFGKNQVEMSDLNHSAHHDSFAANQPET